MFRAVLCGAFIAVSANAVALEIKCPEKIVTSQKIIEAAPGWKEFVRPDGDDAKPHRWSYVEGISLYSGDPTDIAQLKPDDENAQEDSWTFGAPSSPERPLYMACVYSNTRMQFVRALPLTVKKCTAGRGRVLRCEEWG